MSTYHRPLHICFVDLRKAYDSVDRHTLWLVLQHCYHLPPKLLTIIKASHDHTSAAVRSYGKISDPFSISVGVKQGCVLAPTLFNLFFDAVIWLAITDNHSGVCLSYLLGADLVGNRKKLTSEVSVSDLEYADDMALISDSFDTLTTLLESLDSTCRLMGLSINYKKTKFLSVLLSQLCSPLYPPVRPRNSHASGAVGKSSTELCDALSPLHSWSVSMGWPERHLHQEGRTHPESLLNADPESSSSLGSHHVHANGPSTKAIAGVCTSPWQAVSRGTEVVVE